MGLDEFRGYLRFSEDVASRAERLYCYGSLMRSEDCTSRKAARYLEKSEALLLRLAKAKAPLERWLSGLDARGKELLDDGNAARLFSAVPELEYVLWDKRQDAAYLLPPEQEDALAVRESTVLAPVKMRRDSMEAAQRYTIRLPDGKRERDLTYHEFIAYEGHPLPEVRGEYERSLVRGYHRNRNAYVDMFLTSALAWSREAEARGFPSSISMRNRQNGLPDEVVEAMLSSCMENKEVFQRYFRWRAEKLGVERLRSCDLEAPLTPDTAEERAIPFQEGLETVLAAFRRMSERYASCLEDAVRERHIDSHPRKGKDEDYFTSAIGPGVKPYMLIHWDGGYQDLLWARVDLLILYRPGDMYSVWRAWREGTRDLAWRYINLEEPWRRTPIGFDSKDLYLDLWSDPESAEWHWKDDDEAMWSVEQGRLPATQLSDARAEGERAMDRIRRREPPHDRDWDSWRPDPAWPTPVLPETWRRFEPTAR